MGSFVGTHGSPSAERQRRTHLGFADSASTPAKATRPQSGMERIAKFYPPRKFLVAAFDLDGTLTDPALNIVPQAQDRLRQLGQRGIRRILITGRSRAELVGREQFLQEFDAVLLESGAIDNANKEARGLADQALAALRLRCAAAQIPCRVGEASLSIPIQFGKRLYAWPEASRATIHANRNSLDVTPAGEDKGAGLRRTLARWEVPASQCIAFGDAPNDLPMFSSAGYAVAVENAGPDVKELAHEVAPGYGGHAVSDFLERRILRDPS